MAQWDDILLEFLRETPGVELRMKQHRITTDLRDGGMGLRQAWWAFITRWVTLGQNEVRQTGSTDCQLSATPYRYLDAVRALGGTARQRISCPRIHRPLADGLFDSESSEEAGRLQAGRLQVTTYRLSYDGLTQLEEPTPEETREVTQTLPQTRNVLGVIIYYTKQPTTRRWYTDGSKRHGRAGGGISNGDFRATSACTAPSRCIGQKPWRAPWPQLSTAKGRNRARQPVGGEGYPNPPQGRSKGPRLPRLGLPQRNH